MINDNILGDRLNSFREGEIEEDKSEEYYKEINKIDNTAENIFSLALKIMEIGIVFIRSISYGFATKTIFATDWKFVAFLAVGFSIDLIITNISNIFNKKDT
jgi:hypothetical protein